MTKRRWLKAAPPILSVLLFGVALFVLDRALQHHSFREIGRQFRAIPSLWLAAAFGLTILDYLVLTGFDTLALRYAGRRLAYRRTALASFISYAFSHNIGLSLITGVSVRYRLYSAWGLSAFEIAKVAAFCGMTFWLGYLTLGGVVFLIDPPPLPPAVHLHFGSLRLVGVVLVLLLGGVVLASLLGRSGFRIRGRRVRIPAPRTLVAQIVVSCGDWALAGSVLYVLLPAEAQVSWPAVLGAFLVAQIAGLASNIPGGLGVFETVVVLFLHPAAPPAALIGALLAFRAIYYLLPLAAAAVLLGVHEVVVRRVQVERVARTLGRWGPQFVPQVMAFSVFIGGVLLLLSGATPAAPGRLRLLHGVLPLPLLEASHFLGSLVGAGLLILARGLQRRLDVAWWLTMVLLVVGIPASLLKGLDWEEALVLALLLAVLAPCHRHFYRSTSLIEQRFSGGWTAAVVLALGSAAWLSYFAFKHLEYSSELWWRFAVHGDAPRALRALVGALTVAGLFGVARLLAPAPPRSGPPGAADLERVRAIVAASPRSSAQLALLGDKLFLFGAGASFIMYGVRGRTFVALGDPVGPPADHAELAWQFRELCDRSGAAPTFYQVGAASLPIYLDLGLNFLKLGEEARVPLPGFSLEGHARKWLRYVVRRAQDEGFELKIVPKDEIAALLPRLRQVSDTWLESRKTREKRFSLGCFDEDYLANFEAAVVQRNGEIVAFANIWRSGGHEEISVDLMRFVPGLPPVLMDFLFVELMLWGQREGYRWFDLGVCPLSGLESRRGAPPWQRLGALVYRHGENFYNFQGLRQYKEKFLPEWSPVYLAYPGGLALPRVLANVTALISGGLKGAVSR